MGADGTADAMACVVCGETMTPDTSAECNWCDGRYHLNQRNDVEGKDCGQVWIDEQFLALQFACNNCLSGAGAPAAPTAPVAQRTARRTGGRRRYKKWM